MEDISWSSIGKSQISLPVLHISSPIADSPLLVGALCVNGFRNAARGRGWNSEYGRINSARIEGKEGIPGRGTGGRQSLLVPGPPQLGEELVTVNSSEHANRRAVVTNALQPHPEVPPQPRGKLHTIFSLISSRKCHLFSFSQANSLLILPSLEILCSFLARWDQSSVGWSPSVSFYFHISCHCSHGKNHDVSPQWGPG